MDLQPRAATGKHSIAKSFTGDDGNIWFKRLKHAWDGDKCQYCRAGKPVFDLAEGLETHAYAFIHTDNIKTRLTDNRKILETLEFSA
jgi:hypothetical protein